MTLTTDSPSRTAPQVVVVLVEDDLDLAGLPRVRETLGDVLSLRPPTVIVDLSGCGFVDAAGLNMLLAAHRRAWRVGSRLRLRGCSPRILRLLSLTGLHRVFDVEASAA